MQLAYIGLGSNLDKPYMHIKKALLALARVPQTKLVRSSSIYKTRPIGPPQGDYLNSVVCLQTNLGAFELLSALQKIELQHGRKRIKKWGPRTLDLDILLYANQVLYHPKLKVPHPEIAHRNFVLIPLNEIAPELVLPDHTTIKDLHEVVNKEGVALYHQQISTRDIRL